MTPEPAEKNDRIVISEKIVGAEVVKPKPTAPELTHYSRPEKLPGTTYKIHPPTMEAAVYITINHIVLPDGKIRPLEIFLATKDLSSRQWMMAVTRLLSAIFRQPLPFEFAVRELQEITDENGGYFIPGGGGHCGGVVSHIGKILEQHLQDLGVVQPPEPKSVQLEHQLQEKREQVKATGTKGNQCPKCSQYTYHLLDGCWTCIECGYSKCG